MKKMLFFIPAIIFTLFYGFIAITAIGAISPIVIGWLVLFIVAGILLSRTVFWGSLFGILPAIHLIYMSMQETGQVGNVELPLGIIALLFYVLCGCFVYKRRVALGEGDTKNRIKNVLNYKKPAFWVIVVSAIAIIAIGVGLMTNPTSDRISMQWAKSLRVEDIVSVELVTTYGDENNRYQLCEPEQFPDIVKLVNGSRGKYIPQPEAIAGGGRTLYINTLDGTRHRLSNNGNVYLVIDEDSFEISRFTIDDWGWYSNGNAAIPENFNYTLSVDSKQWDMRPMVMVEGILYLDTGKEVASKIEDGAILGKITSAVEVSTKPTQNGQCNFNSGVGAKYATYEDGIAVFLEHKWFFFEEEADDTISAAYTMMKLGINGEVLSSYSLKSKELADEILFDALSKSAAWEGVDVNTLEECYLIRKTLPKTGEVYDYYAYHLTDGTPVLQNGTDGRYSTLSSDLYLQLVDSFQSNSHLFFWLKPDEPPQLIGDTAANVWLKSFMNEQTPAESRISDYTITDVTVISGEPKKGTKWEDMAYQYVVQVTYNITTATEQYLATADGISGKGSFQGLFRELCVKVKASDGGGFQIVAVGTGDGEQEFLKE